MSRENHLVLAVVTAPPGVLLLHRPGETPPAVLPGGRPEPRESPGATAERGCLEETRVRIRAGRQLGRSVVDGIATTYVAARPVSEPSPDEVAVSLQVAWYRLEQVDLVLPELWAPVREHLEKALRAM
ncbi:NUDIX domain-containing protein [Actinomycetospora sp. TBRC 11914]|uniref:NUDIX domain-containing protein n=1 Tax=Actinomycetospora sp. TBRC 11914 TaxID=2729387 RepID=UPI00145F9835|nr:NUDIX hydrolase [Actinomycetospora sp. TBRC 11914]NMO89914.1 NUDIX hydrolase [Actinomycetospora sp. TBRC 11914]